MVSIQPLTPEVSNLKLQNIRNHKQCLLLWNEAIIPISKCLNQYQDTDTCSPNTPSQKIWIKCLCHTTRQMHVKLAIYYYYYTTADLHPTLPTDGLKMQSQSQVSNWFCMILFYVTEGTQLHLYIVKSRASFTSSPTCIPDYFCYFLLESTFKIWVFSIK